jgi:hypothetical protein
MACRLQPAELGESTARGASSAHSCCAVPACCGAEQAFTTSLDHTACPAVIERDVCQRFEATDLACDTPRLSVSGLLETSGRLACSHRQRRSASEAVE